MRFDDALWNVHQRVQYLLAYWGSFSDDEDSLNRTFYGASMQDLLQVLRTERQAIDAQFARLIRDLERGVALLNAGGFPHTQESLCRLLERLGPYMEQYPMLSAREAWKRFSDNTLDQHYPLDNGTR